MSRQQEMRVLRGRGSDFKIQRRVFDPSGFSMWEDVPEVYQDALDAGGEEQVVVSLEEVSRHFEMKLRELAPRDTLVGFDTPDVSKLGSYSSGELMAELESRLREKMRNSDALVHLERTARLVKAWGLENYRAQVVKTNSIVEVTVEGQDSEDDEVKFERVKVALDSVRRTLSLGGDFQLSVVVDGGQVVGYSCTSRHSDNVGYRGGA